MLLECDAGKVKKYSKLSKSDQRQICKRIHGRSIQKFIHAPRYTVLPPTLQIKSLYGDNLTEEKL